MDLHSDEIFQKNFPSKLKEILANCYSDEDVDMQPMNLAGGMLDIPSYIPWLNETPFHNLKTNQLVRFRGMIQDMLNPEFYMDIYVVKDKDGNEHKKPGRYLDSVACQLGETIVMDSPNCKTKDRLSFLCISTPGENKWVKQVYENQIPEQEISPAFSNDHLNNKRSLTDKSEIDFMEETTKTSDDKETPHQEGKKLKHENGTLDKKKNSTAEPLYFPFSDTNAIACLIKTYDDYELMLNEVVEVVGFLSVDPVLSVTCEDDEMEQGFGGEIHDRFLPPSLTPRLHVVHLEKKTHCNPLLPNVIEKRELPMCSSNMRELIGSIFDVLFLGDELAAEYFICHLISSVYTRQDIIPLGKFSINLSGITQELQDKNYPKLFYNLLETLTTHCHFFSMTIENMNTLDFVPRKDYEENCLNSGLLQLPKNLHLVVDETQLSAGKLDTKGIMNLASLKNLMDWQRLDYDFQFHKLEQLADIPVIILSEGKSMLSCDFQIKLDPKHTDVVSAFSQVESLLTPQVLDKLRSHLTLARLSSYSLSDNMQTIVQNDFVSSRKHEGGMTENDLHRLLTLARLLAQSCGKEDLTEDVWKSAKMLEMERKGRFRTTE